MFSSRAYEDLPFANLQNLFVESRSAPRLGAFKLSDYMIAHLRVVSHERGTFCRCKMSALGNERVSRSV